MRVSIYSLVFSVSFNFFTIYNMAKKVMVFGVFDRLHPGHHYFLETASNLGDSLIVVVARDSSVSALKNKQAVETEDERLQKVGELAYVTNSVLGDEILGTYEVIKTHQPDLICLGYDQYALGADLRGKVREGFLPNVEIISLEGHQSDAFHSSLLP